MCPDDETEVVVVEEGPEHVPSEGPRNSPVVGGPPSHLLQMNNHKCYKYVELLMELKSKIYYLMMLLFRTGTVAAHSQDLA